MMKAISLTLFFLILGFIFAFSIGIFYPNKFDDAGVAFHNGCCDAQAYRILALLIWCIVFLKKEANYARGGLIMLAAILILMIILK